MFLKNLNWTHHSERERGRRRRKKEGEDQRGCYICRANGGEFRGRPLNPNGIIRRSKGWSVCTHDKFLLQNTRLCLPVVIFCFIGNSIRTLTNKLHFYGTNGWMRSAWSARNDQIYWLSIIWHGKRRYLPRQKTTKFFVLFLSENENSVHVHDCLRLFRATSHGFHS